MAMEISSGVLIRENVLVDPFMTDLKTIVLLEPPRYLLRAPVLLDQYFGQDPCGCIDAIFGFLASGQCKLMGLLRSISFQSAIPSKLFTDRGVMNADQVGNLRLVAFCFQKCVNLVSLFLGELRVSSHTVPVSVLL
jgi:hypothetical protein